MPPKSEYTREELQTLLKEAMNEKLSIEVVPINNTHINRLVRALLRMAAVQAVRIGMPLTVFYATAADCYLRETTKIQPEHSEFKIKVVEPRSKN